MAVAHGLNRIRKLRRMAVTHGLNRIRKLRRMAVTHGLNRIRKLRRMAVTHGLDRIRKLRRMAVAYRGQRLRTIVLVGAASALGITIVLAYLWNTRPWDLSRDEVADHGARIAALELELEDARRRLADASLAREVDRQALSIQRETIAGLQDTVRELREQLGFFRRILDAPPPGLALEVAEFEVTGREESGAYRFRVLLTRSTERGDWISGTARLEVAGVAGGGRELSLLESNGQDPNPLKYRFRYFQRLTGSLSLPDDFQPLRVTVKLSPRGNDSAQVERTFDWPRPL